jgi:tetratricopeptide (TPR) repeat protein
MVDEATTWGALLDRRRDDSFIGRERALADFRLNMVYEVPPKLLFYVSGPEGIGKSALLSRYGDLAGEHGFLTARVDGAQARGHSESAILAALEAIASQFADQGTPLTTFSEQHTDYLDALSSIAEDPQAPARPLDGFEGVSAEGEWHQRFWTPYLATRFSTRMLPVLRQPVPSLSSVFVSDLNAWASIRNLVLFFDDWQALRPVMETWLVDLLREGDLHINVWLVVADVTPPGERWKDLAPVMQSQALGTLSEQHVRAYGRLHPDRTWDDPDEAYAVTGGTPLLLHLLMEVEDLTVSGADVPLVDEFLASLDGVQRKAVARSAAARRLSPDVMNVLLDGDVPEAFDRLRRSPLLVEQGDVWVYHARVRDRVRAWAQREHPEDWAASHAALVAYYRNPDEDAFARGRGRVVRRWARAREWLYHRLVVGGAEARDEAQIAFVDALRTDYRWAAEIVATWQSAADTPGAPDAVVAWAPRLAEGWDALRDRDWTSALAFVDGVLEEDDLHASVRPAYSRLRNWIAGRLGLPLEEDEEIETAEGEAEAAEVPEPEVAPVPMMASEAEPPARALAAVAEETAPSEPTLPSEDTAEEVADSAAAPETLSPSEPEAHEEEAPVPEQAAGARMAAKAEETRERADALFEEGDYLGAVQIYSRAIDQDPSSITAYFNRGLTHLELNQIGAAIDDFTQVLALNPDHPSAYYQRGMAYVRREELPAAIEDFGAALALMPESAALYARRASAYYRLQAYQRALDDYTQALTLRPNDVTLLLNRGLTYLAMGDVERAIADYDHAIEQAPEHALAYYYRGQAYMEQDEEGKALADFERALQLDPDNAQIHTGLGMVHARMLDFDQALDAYERAMALDSENARAYYNAACAAALSEREDRALTWLEKAISLRPQYRIMARQDPDFSFVRDHPAFLRLTTE